MVVRCHIELVEMHSKPLIENVGFEGLSQQKLCYRRKRWLRYSKPPVIIIYMLMKGYMYILLCSDGTYYTGSTNNLERRLEQHQNGEGANHTKKRLPVSLLYYEEYQRIDEAFYREKQVQGWSRKKKEALIEGNADLLPELAKAYRDLI